MCTEQKWSDVYLNDESKVNLFGSIMFIIKMGKDVCKGGGGRVVVWGMFSAAGATWQTECK